MFCISQRPQAAFILILEPGLNLQLDGTERRSQNYFVCKSKLNIKTLGREMYGLETKFTFNVRLVDALNHQNIGLVWYRESTV